MVYKYNRKTEKMDFDRLSDAIEAVKNGNLTIKAASRDLNVDRNTKEIFEERNSIKSPNSRPIPHMDQEKSSFP